jgi:DNA-binding NarL/FixJ family response regulator
MSSIRATPPAPLPPVLVVTHVETHAALVRDTLGAAGLANPVVSVSGAVAAAAYVAGRGRFRDRHRHPLPAVVVTDLRLGGSNAAEVLESLAAARAGDLPVLVVGDDATDAEIEAVHQLGAAAYLARAVLGRALVDVIRGLGMRWSLAPVAAAR